MSVSAGLAVFGRAGVKYSNMMALGLPRRSASVVASSFGMRTALLSRQESIAWRRSSSRRGRTARWTRSEACLKKLSVQATTPTAQLIYDKR